MSFSRLPVARLPLREAFGLIDWAAPWLAPYRAHGESACARVLAGASVAQALNERAARLRAQLAAGPLRFVPQAELPEGQAYEGFIFATAQVPTRDHLHDFFNGLVWLAEPALKRRLNELHAAAIASEGVGARRSPLRDALTLFDESGALLDAPPELLELLRQRRWKELLWDARARWLHGQARLRLVGHALMEQLVQPYKGITAHVWPAAAAWTLEPGLMQPRLPLPVLGVPGWWAANAQPGFYDDGTVFRSLQSSASVRSRPSSLAR